MPLAAGDLWLAQRGLAAYDRGPVATGRSKTASKSGSYLSDGREQYIFKRISIKVLSVLTQLASLAVTRAGAELPAAQTLTFSGWNRATRPGDCRCSGFATLVARRYLRK